MSVATMNEKIGPPSHVVRNLVLMVAAIVAAAVMGTYYASSAKTEATEIGQLDRFRALVAEKCDAPEFAAPVQPVARELYLSSVRLRDAIERQRLALSSGASCEEVFKALRAADFPLPPPAEPPPVINLQTSQAQ